ncbi:MAG: hypothetical protein O2934_02505 [Bacteroidetes bacterium]|nr:hypothetical protein [Bacteroidota bacterium]
MQLTIGVHCLLVTLRRGVHDERDEQEEHQNDGPQYKRGVSHSMNLLRE